MRCHRGSRQRGREKLSAHKPSSLEPSKFEAQRVLDSVSLPCYHRELRDVPKRNVSRWLAQQKKMMVDIFQRTVYCRRHESFISGTRGRGIIARSENCCLLASKYFCYKLALALLYRSRTTSPFFFFFSSSPIPDQPPLVHKGTKRCHHFRAHERLLLQELHR